MIQFKLEFGSYLPRRSNKEAAGFDLFSTTDDLIQPGERLLIDTGVRVAIPKYTVGLIKPRSGLALSYGIDVLAGVIDSDYRGTIGVLLINHGHLDYIINVGDRIAQIVFQQFMPGPAVVVEELPVGDRGDDGFGSTGS